MAIGLLAILVLFAFGANQALRAQDPLPLDSAAVTALPGISDDADTCAGSCGRALPSDDSGQRYRGSIPLHTLGFVPRVNRELLAPENDEALAWLSPDQLLVAFNPHPLVPRHGIFTSGSAARVIRAALVDVSTHMVKRMVEWHICDRGQFLWELPGNKVLVHVGNEMRIYGADLRMERRISLAGPLAFARISPDGKTLELGVVLEPKPAAAKLQFGTIDQNTDPVDTVAVVVLDDQFAIISSNMSRSDREAPILLNEGQIAIELSGSNGHTRHYTLELRTSDHQSRSLAAFQSACAPEISSLPPDLLFLVTCGTFNYARELRVLRPDGTVVLRRKSTLSEMGQAAGSCGRSDRFAIRIFNAGSPMLPGEPFHAADLASARVEIYRSQDGKLLFSARVRAPAASGEGYAVSSEGEVAILSQDGVDLFDMPQSALQQLP